MLRNFSEISDYDLKLFFLAINDLEHKANLMDFYIKNHSKKRSIFFTSINVFSRMLYQNQFLNNTRILWLIFHFQSLDSK